MTTPDRTQYCMTTQQRALVLQLRLHHPLPSMAKLRWELSLLLSLSTMTEPRAQRVEVLRRPLLCLIQP